MMPASVAIGSWTQKVQVLAPTAAPNLKTFLETKVAPVEPFASHRIDALSALSEHLLKDSPALRQDPASVATAFWLRKSNLVRFREAHRARNSGSVLWVPVGRVFHVAPSNVDTLFLYSWALAYLTGNQNVVRLSKEQPFLVGELLKAIETVALRFPDLATANRFVTYDHDAVISGKFSTWCGHRIVWGGNETVLALREVPLNPHASERSFASKYSYSLIKASSYLSIGTAERAKLASAFHNDFFWFDQAACSSPQVLFWCGSESEVGTASPLFFENLQTEASRRNHTTSTAMASRRVNAAFDLAARTEVRIDFAYPALAVAIMQDNHLEDKVTCGGGFLRVVRLATIEELIRHIDDGDQTLTHFGFEPHELSRLAHLAGPLGLDRIVPMGEALAFESVWDGFDLIEDCLRRVTVRI